MWRLVFSLVVLIGVGFAPASAQEWYGTAGLDVAGGYQTNLYLDPVIGTWNPNVSPSFAALTPQVGLTRTTGRSRLGVTVRSRVHPRRTNVPQLAQMVLQFRRQLTSDVTLGFSSGGTRYRFTTTETNFTTAQESWWGLPSLQWSPTQRTMIRLRTGLTQRFEHSFAVTDRQTSGLASVRLSHWLSDRVQGAVRLYTSNGRTSVAETSFGGTGGSVAATYWPSNAVSLQARAGAEVLEYDRSGRANDTATDRIAHVGLEVEWSVAPSVSAFGRADRMYASVEQGSDARTDYHLSAGLRLQVQQLLGGSSEPPSRRQRVCRTTESGVRVRIPYEGSGTVHVTGDFNNWSLPGVPLTHADDDTWRTTLQLPPGRYAYRFRVVDGDDARWLDLPSYAQTTQDSFGSTNGVCTVH